MKEELINAHNKAFEQANLALDVYFLIEKLQEYSQNEKTKEEIIKEIADKYKEPIEIYLNIFKDELIEEEIHKAFENRTILNNEEFSVFLEQKTIELTNAVFDYVMKRTTRQEFVDYLVNGFGKEVCVEFINLSGVNIADVKVIIATYRSKSYDLLAYAALCEVYKIFMQMMDEADLIHQQRLQIEQQCSEVIQKIREYRAQIEEMVSQYLSIHITSFQEGIQAMDTAIMNNDSNGYIKGNVMIQDILNYDVQFTNQDEFDDLMESDLDFKL